MELTRKNLYDLIWSKPMTTVCKSFGLSDNGLRKHCKAMNIPTPPVGYWAKLKAGYKEVIPALPTNDIEKKQLVILHEINSNKNKKKEVIPALHTKDIEDIELTTLSVVKSNEKMEVDITTPLNQFKIREIEIEAGDISNFIVPVTLKAKDPLIVNTKEKNRKKIEIRNLKRDFNTVEIKNTLSLNVDNKSIIRVLLIYETIMKALRSRGHDLINYENKTYAVVHDEKIEINTIERKKLDPIGDSTFGGRSMNFCGDLIFNFEYDSRNKGSFLDTKFTKLEEKIITIIASLEIHSEQIKVQRIESDRKEKIRLEDERDLREFRIEQEHELYEFKSLLETADLQHKSIILRQFISSYEQFILEHGFINEKISKKLKWAKEKADWLDPFVSKGDLYLDHCEKDEIFQHDCPKSNSLNYHEYSKFKKSFWSRPFSKIF